MFPRIRIDFIGLLLAMFTACCACSAQQTDSPEEDYSAELPRIAPLAPAEAQREFEVLPGFEVHLVACEPIVTDPVAFAFDAKGRLWVVEMRDYSEQETERLGRVALLSDNDGDGQMDHRTTFVENLSWPTAIWPWLDGVLVAEPPHLTWYRDRDGDGRADESEVWFSGFGRSNVQGLVNSLRWGVDHWIHGATSSAGASLTTPLLDNETMELGRRDFGIDPMTRKLRPESGGGQHGMSFNRWGDKFVTSNSDHLQQIIDMESWLAANVSSVPFPSVRRSIAEDGPQAEVYRASPVEPWRIVRTRLRMSGMVPGVVEGGGRAAGYFTGATGTWIMDSERGYGASGMDTALVCDVGSNLVHRKRLVDQGLFFTSQRIDEKAELLRSRDIWFRPVQLGDGPDGALYIADMYREVIEHPLSLPPIIKQHLDLTSGRDRGRIWKITSSQTPSAAYSDLNQLTDSELVAHLESPIAWQRLMASQVLVERNVRNELDKQQAGDVLYHSALHSTHPETRILALWLIARLELDRNYKNNERLLSQTHPRVLAHAIEAIGTRMVSNPSNDGAAEEEALIEELVRISKSSEDSRVHLSLARLAPRLDEQPRLELLGLLQSAAREPIVRASIATAAGNHSWKLFRTGSSQKQDVAEYANWLTLLLPSWIAVSEQQSDLAEFMRDALQQGSPEQQIWLTALSKMPSHSNVSRLLGRLDVQTAIDTQIDGLLEEEIGLPTLKWLGLLSPSFQEKWLTRIIQDTVSEAHQITAISALSWANHSKLIDHLVAQFPSMTPSLQQASLRSITARPERLHLLAAALESGQVLPSQINAEIRQSLLAGRDPKLNERFTSLLNQISTDREEVIERYRSILDSEGMANANVAKGKAVFQRSCAQCHRMGEVGNDVGPPLRQLSEKSPLQLLETILDPSREVDPKYAAYVLLTVEGTVVNGIIVQESGNQIVIAEAEGRQTTLDRGSIEQIRSTGRSLMPEGLEEQISPQDMLDLIQFLITPEGGQ